MAGRKSQEASELFNELTNYERKGIEITLNIESGQSKPSLVN